MIKKNIASLYPLRDSLLKIGLVPWALQELESFRNVIASAKVSDNHRSAIDLREVWYDVLHKKLNEYGFVNGEPDDNTWEKRPKACFYFAIYLKDPAYHRPYHGYHLSSGREYQEQALNLLDDFTEALKSTEAIQ